MIEVVECKCTCSGCPSQWEARTSEGEWLYIRFRHGALSVENCGPMKPFAEGWKESNTRVKEIMSYDESGGDGFMDFEELKIICSRRIKFNCEETKDG